MIRFFILICLFKGIKEKGQGRCQNIALEGKISNAIPHGYVNNVFCAQNPIGIEATCPGDSGKKLQHIQK